MKLSQLITHFKLRKNLLQVSHILMFKYANEAFLIKNAPICIYF